MASYVFPILFNPLKIQVGNTIILLKVIDTRGGGPTPCTFRQKNLHF